MLYIPNAVLKELQLSVKCFAKKGLLQVITEREGLLVVLLEGHTTIVEVIQSRNDMVLLGNRWQRDCITLNIFVRDSRIGCSGL